MKSSVTLLLHFILFRLKNKKHNDFNLQQIIRGNKSDII